MSISKLSASVLALAVALALSACGGGGGDGSSNHAPLAHAGSVQSVPAGSVVTLTAAASTDADGDSLTYRWSLVRRPNGSSATMGGSTQVSPTFTPDIAGDYVFSLIVNDGQVDSLASNVTITAANVAPVANGGSAQSVTTGSLVTLDGSASSDSNGDALAYTWTLTSKPAGSTAALSSTTSVRPTFTADAGGDYVATLTVHDGELTSALATVSVRASTPVSGILAASTDFTKFLSPYDLGGDLSVPGGAVLSLESGVILNGNGNRLVVEGTLRAIGTATERVTINNTKIVPAGKSSGANPSHLIDLAFANITGGTLYAPTGNAIYGSLRLTDSNLNGLSDYLYLWYPGDVVIERNLFQASGGISIGSGGAVSVTNNCFVDWRTAFAVENWANLGAAIRIKKNSFMTRSVAVRLPTGYTNASLDATQNYWGTQDATVIQDMIFDRNDDLTSNAVIPYLPNLSGHDPQTPCP